jgi:Flp pilus assembly protein TadG
MRIGSYWREERGSGAAEFAIVLIPFLALVFGIINVSMMMYANHTLQYATEAAARCYSVLHYNTTCSTVANVKTYAAQQYKGPAISPVFTPSATGCGHTVTATGTFALNAVVYTFNVPLSAQACFP